MLQNAHTTKELKKVKNQFLLRLTLFLRDLIKHNNLKLKYSNYEN